MPAAAAKLPTPLACMLHNALEIGRPAPEDSNVSTQHRQVRTADLSTDIKVCVYLKYKNSYQ